MLTCDAWSVGVTDDAETPAWIARRQPGGLHTLQGR